MIVPVMLHLLDLKDADVPTWLSYGDPPLKTMSVRTSDEGLLHTYESADGNATKVYSDRDILTSLAQHADAELAGRLVWKISRLLDTGFMLDSDLRDFVEKSTEVKLERTPFYLDGHFAVNSLAEELYKSEHKQVDHIKFRTENKAVTVAVDVAVQEVKMLLLTRLRRMLWQS
jgi:hypothetical protein